MPCLWKPAGTNLWAVSGTKMAGMGAGFPAVVGRWWGWSSPIWSPVAV